MKAPRSVLYVPAQRPAMLEKLPGLGADAYIIDLEDAVPAADKVTARDGVRAAVRAGALGPELPWMLRVNPRGTPWHDADLALAAECLPRHVVLPKVERAEEVATAANCVAGWGGALALTFETARGVAFARTLVGAHPAVDAVLLGSADLRRALGATPDEAREWERHAMGELLLAARLTGAAAIDSVYFHFRDEAGLRRHAQIARNLGWDGKSCIHPAQIQPIHEVFRSTTAEIEWAHRVVDAWRSRGDEGVVAVDGEMIEALHADLAERILARA